MTAKFRDTVPNGLLQIRHPIERVPTRRIGLKSNAQIGQQTIERPE
jgi:hypothetical protein